MLTLSKIPGIIFVVMFVFIFISTIGMQAADASLIPRNETKMGISNSTLPEQNNNSGTAVGGNTEIQNCQMPPCPPGEMCIQVCPDP